VKNNRKMVTRLEAEQKAAKWLYLGNIAAAKGLKDLAERHYGRAQFWHDKSNEL
jgi:hypothetical protein